MIDFCLKCGKCCYCKFILYIDDKAISIFSHTHCKYLDEKTKLCKIFENRHEINPNCLSIIDAIKIKALPNDCPYVKDLSFYEGPKDILGVFKK